MSAWGIGRSAAKTANNSEKALLFAVAVMEKTGVKEAEYVREQFGLDNLDFARAMINAIDHGLMEIQSRGERELLGFTDAGRLAIMEYRAKHPAQPEAAVVE